MGRPPGRKNNATLQREAKSGKKAAVKAPAKKAVSYKTPAKKVVAKKVAPKAVKKTSVTAHRPHTSAGSDLSVALRVADEALQVAKSVQDVTELGKQVGGLHDYLSQMVQQANAINDALNQRITALESAVENLTLRLNGPTETPAPEAPAPEAPTETETPADETAPVVSASPIEEQTSIQ
jgi:hypothetical protein